MGYLLTKTGTYSAYGFLALSAGFLVAGMSPTSFVPFAPNVSIRMTSLILFSVLFLVVMRPLYSVKAPFLLGLVWGSTEGFYNFEKVFLYPKYEFGGSGGLWIEYMGFVALLCAVSFLSLRRWAKPNVLGLVLLFESALWPLTVGAMMFTNTAQPLSTVLLAETLGDVVNVAAMWSLFPPRVVY